MALSQENLTSHKVWCEIFLWKSIDISIVSSTILQFRISIHFNWGCKKLPPFISSVSFSSVFQIISTSSASPFLFHIPDIRMPGCRRHLIHGIKCHRILLSGCRIHIRNRSRIVSGKEHGLILIQYCNDRHSFIDDV